MSNIELEDEIILTTEQQVVILKVEALEEYLGIDNDDWEIVEYNEDDDEFIAEYRDDETNTYKVYTSEEMFNIVKYELIPQEIENAKDELRSNMRNSSYSSEMFNVDEEEIESYCFENYEEIMDTQARELHSYKGED